MLHGHRSLIGRSPASTYWFDFAARAAVDRIVHSGKFNWTYVLGSALMDPLYRGKTVIAHEGRNDAATWPRLIAKHGATIFIGVPTIYRQILQKTTFTSADVPTLRHCMSAGEHLSDEVFAPVEGALRPRHLRGRGHERVQLLPLAEQAAPDPPGQRGLPAARPRHPPARSGDAARGRAAARKA